MLLQRYLEANLLLAIAFCVVVALRGFNRLRPSQFVAIHHLLFLSILISMPLPLPSPSFTTSSAQLWSAPSMKAASKTMESRSYLSVGNFGAGYADWDWIRFVLLAIFVAGFLGSLLRFAHSIKGLRKILKESIAIKRLKRVEVRVSEKVEIPFSCWLGGTSYVVAPVSLLTDISRFELAIRHELQHHRQRDTRWIHLSELMKILFFWNPFCHWLVKNISEFQELACDEALLGRKVSAHAYGRCLIEVAETARSSRQILAGTAGMAAGSSSKLLKRRIKNMFTQDKKYVSKMAGIGCGVLALFVMATAALASQVTLQDRRIDLATAQHLVEVARRNSEFPIAMNEAVLKELNRFVGTPDGREFMRKALLRMESYRPLVMAKIEQYRLPGELMAMPIMESGYINSPQSVNPQYSAGLWQFIPETARNFGLHVNEFVDERLDVEKETDAAMRYLGALYLQFQNWELSILAYNAGEYKVQEGIKETGSRNAWVLIDKGFSGDDGYLAKAIAAILIMKSPHLLD